MRISPHLKVVALYCEKLLERGPFSYVLPGSKVTTCDEVGTQHHFMIM